MLVNRSIFIACMQSGLLHIDFEKDIEEMTPVTFVNLVLCIGKKKYIICEDTLGYILEVLINHLGMIDELELRSEFKNINIGLAQNKYYHMIAEEVEYEDGPYLKEKNNEWIGNKYLLFESKKYSTWVYESAGKSYIEITFAYSWHFSDDADYSYDDFIKEYKQFLKFEISRNLIQEIIEKCKEIKDYYYFLI